MVTDEILPIYHDKFKTTNKSILLIEGCKEISNSKTTIIKCREYSSTFNDIGYKHKKVKSNIKLECQNGNPIQVYKNFKKHTGSPNFILNGFKQGDTIEIKGLGYLGDIEVIKNIFLVTDRYVFTKSIIGKTISCYGHEELKRMKDCGALTIL